MHTDFQESIIVHKPKIITKRHSEIIDSLEKMLEKGVPDLTMSEIASKLKISLRTLYEIAPSKNKLILMTMDNILRNSNGFVPAKSFVI